MRWSVGCLRYKGERRDAIDMISQTRLNKTNKDTKPISAPLHF